MSIDRLAQAFAAMMGEPDPYAVAGATADQLVEVDASPDLDQEGAGPAAGAVTAGSIRVQFWRHCCSSVCQGASRFRVGGWPG